MGSRKINGLCKCVILIHPSSVEQHLLVPDFNKEKKQNTNKQANIEKLAPVQQLNKWSQIYRFPLILWTPQSDWYLLYVLAEYIDIGRADMHDRKSSQLGFYIGLQGH